MKLFPAIDLYQGKAVRLFKGDYDKMTVYSEDPVAVARDFAGAGARCLHTVDLEGAKLGTTPNLPLIRRLKEESGLFTEVGGGIRSLAVIDAYLSAGIDRVILGTAAVTDPGFVKKACRQYGAHIAVGVDILDGYVAIRGWTEKSSLEAFAFLQRMQEDGVKTVICTDISRDGAMRGTNRALYQRLQKELRMDIIASGGVSTLEDVAALRDMGLYGAIIGKAYYTGAIRLSDALSVARSEHE